jgi:hypothetical protein
MGCPCRTRVEIVIISIIIIIIIIEYNSIISILRKNCLPSHLPL